MERYNEANAAEKQVMGALGDSMSVNILMRLLPAALQTAGLWPKAIPMTDHWAHVKEGKQGADLVDNLYAKRMKPP